MDWRYVTEPDDKSQDEVRFWFDSTLSNGTTIGVIWTRQDVGRWLGLKKLRGVGFTLSHMLVVKTTAKDIDLKGNRRGVKTVNVRFPSTLRSKEGNALKSKQYVKGLDIRKNRIEAWYTSLSNEIKKDIISLKIIRIHE